MCIVCVCAGGRFLPQFIDASRHMKVFINLFNAVFVTVLVPSVSPLQVLSASCS